MRLSKLYIFIIATFVLFNACRKSTVQSDGFLEAASASIAPTSTVSLTSASYAADGIYRIRGLVPETSGGPVMEVAGMNVNNGGLLQQWSWFPNNGQKWRVTKADDVYYKIINLNSGKALDVPQATTEAGRQLQQYTDNGTDAQRWKLINVAANTYRLVNKGNGMHVALEYNNANNGTRIVQKSAGSFTGTEDQFIFHNLYFQNPIVAESFADPFVTQKDGYYYAMSTTGSNIRIRKTKNMSLLSQTAPVTVWTPPAGTAYSKNIWAPELHYLDGKWYMYFAANDGTADNHRMHVLENANNDPATANWVYKGKIADASNQWAIDGTVLVSGTQKWFIWSGWESTATRFKQHLYIASMSNPWTISSARVKISSPTNVWEKYEGSANGDFVGATGVNEGPIILKRTSGSTWYLVFSVSRYNSDNYSLATMNLIGGGDPMNAAHWVNKKRVFTSANGVYGPGHNSFFTSGSEHWIFYHARNTANTPNGSRTARIQKISWDSNGAPIFGTPVSTSSQLEIPAGE